LYPFRLRSSLVAQDGFIATQGAIMKRSNSARFLAAAAIATAALGAASAAHANPNVYFSVGVQARPVYMEPESVYVQPQPVYVQPRPVYVQPAYAAPAQVFERPWRPAYDRAYEEERAWRRAEWQRRHWMHHHQDWDQYQSRGRYRD
jgi:PXPV repeat (3 copies)